jgi:hypothetical protein
VFGISHVELVDGRPVSHAMQAMRCGDRIVVFRPCGVAGGRPEFEWAEVTLGQLRTLVAGFVLTRDQLQVLAAPPRRVTVTKKKAATPTTAATKATRKKAAAKRVAPPAAPTTAPPQAPAAAAWAPTHVVPTTGLPAYAKPDPAGSPVATLGARLPVQVTEELGAWAHVVCSNGWAGWSDGRYLEPRR